MTVNEIKAAPPGTAFSFIYACPLQDSIATITQRYIGAEPQRIEQTIERCVQLL